MLLERSMHPDFLSNSYLIAPDDRSDAVYIDAGGPMAPLREAAERLGLSPSRVLLTHHHHDHVAEAAALGLPLLAHPIEAELVDADVESIEPEAAIEVGDLRIEPLLTPGHTAGMLSFHVDQAVFTGDTLFRNSVGGVRAPGATSFADLRRSIMDVLMELPPETIVHPGHTDSSTVAEEWENNPFIRLWRGLDAEGTEKCTVWGDEATLVLWAPDYDGGHKAWVRWPDGRDDIVPGSQVQR
jgi:glyoxylase-like metal-dependent hydrolase (beta-lactamase superfamily II)